MKEYINDYLDTYSKEDWYPWHMPGHKRQDVFENDFWRALFQRDFTEAKNLDDMHEPELFMKDSMHQMQAYYGTIKTYMMVNGARRVEFWRRYMPVRRNIRRFWLPETATNPSAMQSAC